MEEELIEVKKKNKLLPLICILLAVILLAGGGYYYYTNYYNKDNSNKVVEKPRLQDDFYGNLNTNKEPFETAQATAYNNLYEIITEMSSDTNYVNNEYRNFIETFEDYNEKDKNGINELKPYFDRIDNSQTMDEFSKVVVDVQYDLGVNSFLNIGISVDFYNNSRNVITLEPMTLETLGFYLMEDTLPSGLDLFTDSKYSTYKKVLEKARVKYFTQYGYDKEKAKKLSNDITEFAATIQSKSASTDELISNYLKYYKNVSKKELKQEIKNLPIDMFLDKFKISNYQYFAVFDLGHLKELDNYYNIDNLPLMKEILKLLILERVASLYSSNDYAEIFADVYSNISGQLLPTDYLMNYFEIAILSPRLLGTDFDEKYDQTYFTKEEKDEIKELIVKIKDHYVEVIKNTDWLDNKTKEEAIKKLNNLKINLGYTKDEKEIEKEAKVLSKKDGGTLLSNYIIYTKNISSMTPDMIKIPQQAGLEQFKVNAYYNPSDNSINFPVAFKFVYDGITDKHAKYAYAGTVIAHEISHAFDSNGSQYDEKGNVKNWWTEDDKNDFEEKKKKIADYYSKYEVFGTNVDGNLTVAENIADLAAVKTIISIMESEGATNEEYKKFFESYAKLWSQEQNKSMILMSMTMDNHSPNKVRTNAVLSSTDKFYEVYDIKEGDKMFVPKENRVGLW